MLAILTHGESKPQVGRDTLITRALNKLSAILEFDLDLTSSISVIKVYTEEPLFSKTLADVTLDELENLNRYYKSQTVNEKTNFSNAVVLKKQQNSVKIKKNSFFLGKMTILRRFSLI